MRYYITSKCVTLYVDNSESIFIHLQGAPRLEQQLCCVFNQLPQSSQLPLLWKEFSKGQKRVFSCSSQYIRPSLEKSLIVRGHHRYPATSSNVTNMYREQTYIKY